MYIEDGMNDKEAEEKAVSAMGDPSKIAEKINEIHRPKIDFKVLIIGIILLIFGLVIAYIRVKINPLDINGESLYKYALFVMLGLMLSMIIYFTNYRKIVRHFKAIYVITTLAFIVSIFMGVNINGTLYIYTPFITIKPTILSIPLYVISFAGFLGDIINKKNKNINKIINKVDDTENKNKKVKKYKKEYIILIVNLVLSSLLSIFLLYKVSSILDVIILVLIYSIILTIGIYYVFKEKLSDKMYKRKISKYISLIWGSILIVTITAIIVNIIMNYGIISINTLKLAYQDNIIDKNQEQIMKLDDLYGNKEKIKKLNSNTKQAILKVYEGTNYAYSAILINYGWIVTSIMSILIFTFCIFLIIDAIKVKDIYGKLLIVGITSIFIVEYILNILMNLNLSIKVNLGLPLISWGGINLIIHMICLSFVLSIYRRKDILSMRNSMK